MPFLILLLFLLFQAPVFAQAPPLDLSVIAGGARPLALGLAQTSASKDISSVFFNPAGLGNITTTQFSGMTGTLLSEVSYVTGLGAWPTKMGVFGFGYISSELPGVPITSRSGSGGTTVVTLEGTTAYSVTEFVTSYGVPLSRFINTEWAGKLRLGVDGHLTSEQIPGRLNRITTQFSYGFQYVFARPFTMGLVVRPTGITGGIRLFVPEDLYELEVFVDAIRSNGLPMLYRVGMEWRPEKELSFRVGLNQRWNAGSVESGFTGGVGLDLAGLLLNYAYHPVGQFADNTVHFFSLGFEFGRIVPRQSTVKTVIPAVMSDSPNLVEYLDVNDLFWADAPIQYISALGIMSGFEDDTFMPSAAVSLPSLKSVLYRALQAPFKMTIRPKNGYALTRREAVHGIVEAVGLRPPKKFARPFADVKTSDPSAGYISVAKYEGFLEYISGEPFEGDRIITRAEIAEIISKLPIVKIRIKELVIGEGTGTYE